jgi:hypothetical protein
MSSNQKRKRVTNLAGRSNTPIHKRVLYKWHDFKDEWFRDKDGNLVYSQVPNIPLVVFFITGVFAVVSYHGFWHGLTQLIAILSILLWSWLEIRSGVTRMRHLMGKIALGAVLLVVILYLWH